MKVQVAREPGTTAEGRVSDGMPANESKVISQDYPWILKRLILFSFFLFFFTGAPNPLPT